MKKKSTQSTFGAIKRFLKENILSTTAFAALGLLMGTSTINAQTTLVPASGSNTVSCPANTNLLDPSGTSNYNNGCNGFTVLDAGFASVINIQGPYNIESGWDYIYVYSGAGTSGPLLVTYNGNGTANYTGTAGQTLTVRFFSDASVTYTGFDFTVTSTGACFATPCVGAPPSNTAVVSPATPICPNAAASLSLANSYSVGNLTFQWVSSTVSNVGPFTPIANATLTTYNTPTLNTPVYYACVVTCMNGNITSTTTSGQVLISGTTVNNIPYSEGFEGLYANNQFPNCSWSASSPTTICKTYTTTQTQGRSARTGSKFASFYYSPSGTNYYYTNGLNLEAGVTYSASVWFKTEYYGYTNWSDMSIMVGPSQSTTGLVTVASTNGVAASASYMALTNTFVVNTTGVYYAAIRGIADNGCCAQYLNWDDLLIEAPCSLNQPTVAINSSTTTICSGDMVTLTASGASNFAWAHGPTTAIITETPNQNTLYSVVGTNTATGCNQTVNQYIVVNPTPNLIVFADKQTVCAGQPAVLTAQGAQSYVWSTNSQNSFITVNPTAATIYSVIGTSALGCIAQVGQLISVNPLPNVTGSTDKTDICKGESATLTGLGAVKYTWAANTLFVQSQMAIVSPAVATTYTLVGTDANGCSKETTVNQNVLECVGIQEVTTTMNGVKVYPNPTSGVFTVEVSNDAEKTIQVLDVTGRVVLANTGKSQSMNLNINGLSNGIYYVRIQSENAVEVIKVVKN